MFRRVISCLVASSVLLPLGVSSAAAASATQNDGASLDRLARSAAAQDNVSGLKLFRELARENSGTNLVFSPASALGAFSLLYPGAEGGTRAGLAGAFGFPIDLATFVREHSALKADIETAPAFLRAGDTYELTIANDVWHADDFAVRPAYMRMLRDAFDVKAHALPFATAPETGRVAINKAIAQTTHNRIRDLLPLGSIRRDTRLVLTNAIYLLADWASPFSRELTQREEFTNDAGQSFEVDMMHQSASLSYVARPGYQAVALPYKGGTLQMLVVLPTAGGVEGLVESFDAEAFEATLAGLNPRKVNLALPKFTLEPNEALSLNGPLGRIGVRPLFCGDSGVNLGGISETESLCVSDVFQKAFLKVDEKGTEAAAATAIVVGRTSMEPEPPVSFRVDRPALFVLFHARSHAILFASRLVRPE